MRFWDSSALVSLFIDESPSAAVRALYATDPVTVVWWGTPVECASAVARRSRVPGTDSDAVRRGFESLTLLQATWQEMAPDESIRDLAVRLVSLRDLRAADALQLAAALVAAVGRPQELEFVCLDDRLRFAAAQEGLAVLPLQLAGGGGVIRL